MPPELNQDKVKAEIQRYWNAFTGKSAETLAEFFAPEASVFGSGATRPEPGRLAAARRKREYFHPQTTMKATLGPIDILLIGKVAAVATYNLQWHATKVTTALSPGADENIEQGRVTQVFAFDPDGNLRIVHEHISIPVKF